MKIRISFFLLCLLAVSKTLSAQTVSGESNKVYINVTTKPKGPQPALAYSNVTFTDENKNQTIDPLELTSLSFTIRNLGKAASKPMFIKAYTTNEIKGLTFPKENKIDSLSAGQTREISIPITATKALESGTANIVIDIKQEFEYDADQIEINVLTKEKR